MVYIVNSSGHDYSAARKFGELETLTEGNLPIFNIDRMRSILRDKLQRFDIDQDFLLLSGAIVLNVLSVTVLGEETDRIPILIFDAKRKIYIERELSLLNPLIN